jgi:hypothetical protein
MGGVEMMLASMLGMKPAELKEAVTGVIEAIHQANATMKRIETKLDKILENEETLNAGRSLVTHNSDSQRITL